MSYEEDVTFVGVMLRGGDWEIGLRIARNVDPTGKGGGDSKHRRNFAGGRVSLTQFAADCKAAGYAISKDTVGRYLAAWEWAADAGVVDPSTDLAPDDTYDFSIFPENGRDENGDWVDGCWKSFYEIACMNPPPWNPQAKPLDSNYGGGRAEKAATKPPTPAQIAEAIKDNPEHEQAAWQAIVEKSDERMPKRKNPREPAPSSTMEDWTRMTLKFDSAERSLEEALGLAMNIRGFAESKGQREVALERVAKIRKVLDAIAGVAEGESLDEEWKRLAEGIH